MCLVDKNAPLYAATTLPEEDKRLRTHELLAEPGVAVSVRALQEFHHRLTRAATSAGSFTTTSGAYWKCVCRQ